MNQEQDANIDQHRLNILLQEMGDHIWKLAEQQQQDTLALLSLLRYLEKIHRQIRTDLFEASLPETRNNLYQLVKDIEEQGGWPYIEKMKLQDLLQNLELNLEIQLEDKS